MKNKEIEYKEIVEFITSNVDKKKRSELYDHLYYCFLFSGLTSQKDLIIVCKDFTK